jgi:hypothetical protein
MKRVLIACLFFAGALAYIGCQKENSSDQPAVKAAKTNGIKKGEPVLFSVENSSGQTAQWSVSPSNNVQLTSDGNTATVLFRTAGAYSVIATMGNQVQRIPVNVSDSVYCDSTRRDTLCNCLCDTIPRDTIPYDSCRNCQPPSHDTSFYSLAGDKIQITPALIDSGSMSGLHLYSVTGSTYSCTNNYLSSTVSSMNGNYDVSYSGVYVAGVCSGGSKQSQSDNVLFPVQDGMHTFSVTLNNVTYHGSFTKTGNHYSFTWPDASGVTISPLVIN